MFKMMKYEYRRGLFPLMIVLAIIAAAELAFLIGVGADAPSLYALGIGGLMFGGVMAYLFVLVYGIVSYNRDLKDKSGYMVFMTPISSYQVIGAKLLSILLTGATLVVVLLLLLVLDYNVMKNVFVTGVDIEVTLDQMAMGIFGMSFASVMANIAVFTIAMLVQFFTIITIAYLSISLSSTVLQNKKIKGVVSAIIFIVICVLMNWIGDKLPQLGDPMQVNTLIEAIHCNLLQFMNSLIFMLVGYFGSAILLNKKISL